MNAGVTRRCGRCQKVKPIDEFVGKRPGTITTTCLRCREQIDGAKAQGMRLRKALRELFTEGAAAGPGANANTNEAFATAAGPATSEVNA